MYCSWYSLFVLYFGKTKLCYWELTSHDWGNSLMIRLSLEFQRSCLTFKASVRQSLNSVISTRDPRNVISSRNEWRWYSIGCLNNAKAHITIFALSYLENPFSYICIRENLYLIEFKDFWNINFILKRNDEYFILHSFTQGWLESLTSPDVR